MKRIMVSILLGFLVLLSACGPANTSNTIEQPTERTPESHEQATETASESHMEESLPPNENLPLGSVVYYVGEDIEEAPYLVTCTETEYSLKVLVFESKDSYNGYVDAERFTSGEENAAIEQHALSNQYIEAEQCGYVGLKNGNVLLMYDGKGDLEMIEGDSTTASMDNNNPDLMDAVLPVYSGVYFIGDDIDEMQCKLTCTESEFSMKAVIFSNMEDYIKYHQTSRWTNGDESAAIEQYALIDLNLEAGQCSYVGLKHGNVLVINDGQGYLTTIDSDLNFENAWYSGNEDAIGIGVYFAGKDINEGSYELTGNETNSNMVVSVFENEDAYTKYHKTSRWTFGEDRDALEQYALSIQTIYGAKSCSVEIMEGNVLMINDGSGSLEIINAVSNSESMGNDDAVQNGDVIPMLSGVYFVGEDIEEMQYMFTCVETDYTMKVVVFANKEDYINYHRTSRWTNGEESSAIEQNAMASLYISEDSTCCINLKHGMVLMLGNGFGVLQAVSTSWAP